VLKPNGLMVVTTPNVLNMKSRLRYLVSGFANLFGPLPVKNQDRFNTAGISRRSHIFICALHAGL